LIADGLDVKLWKVLEAIKYTKGAVLHPGIPWDVGPAVPRPDSSQQSTVLTTVLNGLFPSSFVCRY
jgi:hypothetical protein